MIKYTDIKFELFSGDPNDLTKLGVYKIRNKITNMIYVGSASAITNGKSRSGFNRRFSHHFYRLQEGNHRNKILQNSWNKYGYSNFEFSIIEICNKEDCLIREDYWIKKLKSSDRKFGYNICPTSLANYYPKSEDEIKNTINRLTGKKRPMSVVLKISKPLLQYDLDGNFIKEWVSVSEAHRILSIQRQDIGQCCLDRGKMAGGFQWRYKIENDFPLKIDEYPYKKKIV